MRNMTNLRHAHAFPRFGARSHLRHGASEAAPWLDLVHHADLSRAPGYAFTVGSIGKRATVVNEERVVVAGCVRRHFVERKLPFVLVVRPSLHRTVETE